MTNPRLPVLRQAADGKSIVVVGDIYRFLATGDETDRKYAIWEAIVPPGGGPPPHTHSREDEGFYILEGEITFQIGDQRFTTGPGTFANMPVGSLISVAPAGLEKMLFEVGKPVPEGATTPPPSKAEIEKLLAVAPKYGIEIQLPAH
jgi:mannose-6-phosphate isomerase-like protein (cupin superfamily)